MNSWKFNSSASYHLGKVITDNLNLPYKDIYKIVKSLNPDGTITTKDGQKYELVLKEV